MSQFFPQAMKSGLQKTKISFKQTTYFMKTS